MPPGMAVSVSGRMTPVVSNDGSLPLPTRDTLIRCAACGMPPAVRRYPSAAYSRISAAVMTG